jgi:hypothetical protein
MAEILASLDDINAELPSDNPSFFVVADDDNTDLLQISVARVVKGYLSGVIDNVTLVEWQSPEATPETINVIAAKLIASQLYFNYVAKTSVDISPDSFAQKRYDEAIAMLNGIISGTIILPDTEAPATGGITDQDYFPIDATGRAFTMGMEL